MNRHGMTITESFFDRLLFPMAIVALTTGAHCVAAENQQLALTVYNNDLALVQDVRTLDFAAGRSRLEFKDVSASIRPETVTLSATGIDIVEQNFDFDLLTPGTIIAKSHGERVQLVRTDRATGRVTERNAIIRSGPDGVVLDIDGRIEALDCSDLAEKLVFERIPAGLADEPALSMTIRAAAAGRHTIQLSYLALGLDWSADYVASINPDGCTLNLTGWLTLVNHASTTFANAPTAVVAGELARDEEETRPPQAVIAGRQPQCWPIGSFTAKSLARARAAAPILTERLMIASDTALQAVMVTSARQSFAAKMSELGDYKLYTLPAPTTVAARQSKQVRLLGKDNVRFQRIYSLTLDEDSIMDTDDFMPRRPTTMLRLQNKKSDGLGSPLPAGVISVMEAVDGGYPVLAGEKVLEDTPVGLPLEIALGEAMDVWIEPRVIEDRTLDTDDDSERHVELEVKIGNDKPLPIDVELRQPAGAEGFHIVSESKPHTLKSGDVLWKLHLKQGSHVVLRYTFRQAD